MLTRPGDPGAELAVRCDRHSFRVRASLDLVDEGPEAPALVPRFCLMLQDAPALFLFTPGLLGESPLAFGLLASRLLTLALLLACPLRDGDDDESHDHTVELSLDPRAVAVRPGLAGTANDPLVDLEPELTRGHIAPLRSKALAVPQCVLGPLDPLVKRDRQPLTEDLDRRFWFLRRGNGDAEPSAFERLDESVHDPERALETPRTDAKIETLLPPGVDSPVETRSRRSEHLRRVAHQGMGIDEQPRDANAIPRLTFEGFLGYDLGVLFAGAVLGPAAA